NLPAPWADADIGNPGKVGGASAASSTSFSVTGGGTDIWNDVDAFHFAYRSLTGDGSIITRVDSQADTNDWAKAGLMIRETSSPDSRLVMLAVTPANGLIFEWRGATHNSASSVKRSGGVGYWLKLTRAGTTFSGAVSTNGTSWS